MNLTQTIVAARKAGTPLVAVTTADQMATIGAIANATDGAPKLLWDAVRGLRPVNDAGGEALAKLGDPEQLSVDSTNPQTALELCAKLPKESLVFLLNAHRFCEDPFVATAVLNLRDEYKTNYRTLVLLGPGFKLPAELQQDVVVIDEPLPDNEQLRAIITNLAETNEVQLDDDVVARAVTAVRGLSAFTAEQVSSMALTKTGLDLESLWDRKRSQIGQTPGVSLLSGGPTLDSIGGNATAVEFLSSIMRGEDPPELILFIDEIDKALGGLGSRGGPGDSSGVTADFLGVMLRWMEDGGHDGMILVSPPGCGKTLLAQAIGRAFNRPTMAMDVGRMRARYVGESEGNVRQAFKVAGGLANGRALVLATCNKLDVLPPELRRRFTFGIWYVDLPSADEKAAIWKIQLAAHGLDGDATDFDENWTGAEIRNCCRIAKRLKISLSDAARYIVPVAVADSESVDALRRLANGRFLSANAPGVYRLPTTKPGAARRVAV